MEVMLKKELRPYFSNEISLFDQLMALSGETVRALEGRSTQKIVLGEKTYFIKQHRGIGWREIFKNLLQGRLPIISAKNEWEALLNLEKLGIPVPKVVAYGMSGMNPATLQSFVMT